MVQKFEYPQVVEESVRDKYRKKLHSTEAMAPRLRARQLTVLTWALTLSVTGYVVLWADFGQQEHCFSSVRRWFDIKKTAFWTLSKEERQAMVEEGRMPKK
ncbi:hypothetical protein BDF14DRAFT_1753722 [Spinellus fusiger]|nr:hypothetical protein BDF14DRAFT_1753722 [Spinellus fusiger]